MVSLSVPDTRHGIPAAAVPDMDVHPPPFKRNPAAWDQRVPIAVLAAMGFGIAGYMSLFQWGLVDTMWDPIFGDGSEKVLESDLSEKMHRYMRMPDAALGALAYLGDAVYGMAGSTRRWQFRPWMVLLFGFDVIPLGIVSIALVIAQGTIVGSWCFLCLVSAFISLILMILAYDEVWACLKYLGRVRNASDWSTTWKTLLGQPSEVAMRAAIPDDRRQGQRAFEPGEEDRKLGGSRSDGVGGE